MQLVLPKTCRDPVLQMAHAIPMAGHLGRKKTTERVLQRFFWPSASKDIRISASSMNKFEPLWFINVSIKTAKMIITT